MQRPARPPFAVGAALLGHVVMGYDLSVVSVFGIIATCGVVVNGGLVLTVTLNQLVRSGIPFAEAACRAGRRRFRPILLTSLTTFCGLAPMIVETSPQARYLVPMAIALGFGIILSSVMILVMMPAVHVLVENARQRWSSLLAPVPGDADREAAPGLHASPNV